MTSSRNNYGIYAKQAGTAEAIPACFVLTVKKVRVVTVRGRPRFPAGPGWGKMKARIIRQYRQNKDALYDIIKKTM